LQASNTAEMAPGIDFRPATRGSSRAWSGS